MILPISPNTRTTVTADKRLEIIANNIIEPGEEITNQYMELGSGKPTRIRKEFLRQNWYFDCNCKRCTDPTECGSNLSSLVCSKPKCRGAVLPLEPLNGKSEWVCIECHVNLDAETADNLLEKAKQIASTQASNLEEYEKCICKMGELVHPGHYLMVTLKERFIIFYDLKNIGRPALHRRLQLCMDIMDSWVKVRIFKNT